MISLIRTECYKLFRMKKLYVFFLVLVANLLLTVYFYTPREGTNISTIITAETANAQSLPLLFLNGFSIYMSIFMAVYVAGIVTDEYRIGTLKLTLLRPVSRMRLLQSKFGALLVFNLIMIAFLIVSAYTIGALFFGWGEGAFYNGVTYAPLHGVALTLASYSLLVLPYMAIGAMFLFIAFYFDQMALTIILSIGIAYMGQFLNLFESIKIYSIVNQTYFFPEYFIKNPNWHEAALSTGVNLLYFFLFYFLSAKVIRSKDIVY